MYNEFNGSPPDRLLVCLFVSVALSALLLSSLSSTCTCSYCRATFFCICSFSVNLTVCIRESGCFSGSLEFFSILMLCLSLSPRSFVCSRILSSIDLNPPIVVFLLRLHHPAPFSLSLSLTASLSLCLYPCLLLFIFVDYIHASLRVCLLEIATVYLHPFWTVIVIPWSYVYDHGMTVYIYIHEQTLYICIYIYIIETFNPPIKFR